MVGNRKPSAKALMRIWLMLASDMKRLCMTLQRLEGKRDFLSPPGRALLKSPAVLACRRSKVDDGLLGC
jgi:hypothetical protein